MAKSLTQQLAVSGPQVDAASRRWVEVHALAEGAALDDFTRIGCGTCAAAGFPDAPSELVQLASDQISFLFLFDDAYAETRYRVDPQRLRAATQPYADVAGGTGAVETPFGRALADLSARARLRAPASWSERYRASFLDYFEGCAREAHWRRKGEVPSLDVYLALRRSSIGMEPMFDVMELALDRVLSPAEHASIEAVELRRLGAELSALVNDLSSLEKEEALGDVCNVVIVMQAFLGSDRLRAREAIIERHDAELKRLSALEARLETTQRGSPLAGYARCIRQWLVGHAAWIRSSRRYEPCAAREDAHRGRGLGSEVTLSRAAGSTRSSSSLSDPGASHRGAR
jgi:5-epi-alpha-selinene synthase